MGWVVEYSTGKVLFLAVFAGKMLKGVWSSYSYLGTDTYHPAAHIEVDGTKQVVSPAHPLPTSGPGKQEAIYCYLVLFLSHIMPGA